MLDLRELPLFPLHTVLFPGMRMPLHIFEERYQLMINECIDDGMPFGVVLIEEGDEVGASVTPYTVGTSAYIGDVERFQDGRINIDVEGQQRFLIHELRYDRPYLVGLVEEYPLQGVFALDAIDKATRLYKPLTNYLDLLVDALDLTRGADELPDDPLELAYVAATALILPPHDKQELLAQASLGALLDLEFEWLNRELGLLKLMLSHARRGMDTATSFSSN